MLLSDFYKTNTKDGRLNHTSDSSRYVHLTCSDYLNNLPSHDLDKSMFMSMCIDSTYNYLYGITFTENNTGFKLETKQKVCDFNATVMTVSNPADAQLYRPKFYDNKFMNGSTLCIMNSVGSSYYLFPIIYAIDKSDFVFYKNQQGIDQNKIKRISLKELYINKDKYYVVSLGTHLMYVDNSSNYYSSFITPSIWKGNDNEIYGAPIGNITAHALEVSINNPSIGIIGYNKEIRPSSSGGSPFLLTYPHTIKGDTIEYSNTDYGNIDIQYTFNNQCEYIETHTGKWKVQSYTNETTGYKYASGVYVMNADFVLKHIAMSGGYVVWDTTNYNSVTRPVSSNTHIAICEMNTDGFLTGDFIVPEMKEYYNGANKESIKYNDNFKPDKYPIPDVKPTEPSQFGNYECKSGGVRYYGMTSTQYFAFNQWINGDLDSGYEPMKSIVYFAYQPFKSNTTFMPDMDNVKIGGKSSVQMKPLNKSTSIYYLGSYNVNRIHNNFLDFSPHTDISVYIPLCGEISIPTNIVMGNTIKTYIITDSQTGGCTGYVTAIVNGSEILIGQRTGQFVQNMPLSSQEVGMRKQAETNALMSVGASTVATGLGIATGSPMAVIGGIGGLIASTVNGLISSNTNRTQSMGSISDVINFNMPVQCYIRISSPDTSIPDNYGHTVGYMTNKTKTISECNGYTVCNNVDVSGLSCTETEKQMIKSALENGCYL